MAGFIGKIKNKIKSIPLGARSAVVYTAATVFSRGLAIITVPIFTRLMSTEQIGIVNLYNTWHDGVVRPQYELIEHHAPIVAPELFDRVQLLMDQGLLSSLKCSFTPEQKRLLNDESWRAGQDRLENQGRRIIMEGGYHNE